MNMTCGTAVHNVMKCVQCALLWLLTLGACARGTVVVRSVCLSVCLSVTTLAAIYLVFKSQMKCHRVLHGVFNRCIVWILLKTLRSKVLA